MQKNTNKNPEETEGAENEVAKKDSFYEKYMPNWYKNMNLKSKAISLLLIVLLISAGGYAAYHYTTMFIMEHIPEIAGIFVFALVVYLLPKTDAWKSFMTWLLVKHKNFKLLGIMAFLSLLVFLVDFQTMINSAFPYVNEKVINNFVVVTFVYLMFWLYLKLFTQHTWMKYAKHIFLIGFLVLFRALFQHHVSPTVEQLLNGVVLAIMGIMFMTFIYESFFVKNKAEQKRIGFVLHIVLYATLVFSPYFTSMFIAKKRIDTINFVNIKTLPVTKHDVPVDEKLANIWMDQKNGQNSATTIPDPILGLDGHFVFMADNYSVNWVDYYIPFLQKPTNSVRILNTDNWQMKIRDVENHANYSDGLMYGHQAHSAVAKKFGPVEYVAKTTENTIKFIDKNDSFYTAELVSALSSYLTPYSVPDSVYIIKDSNKDYDFLFGAGERLSIAEASRKYPFLKKQQIIPLNVVKEVAESSQLLSGWTDKLRNNNILIPDVDKFGNIIIERLYTSIDGHEGVFAHIQLIAKKVQVGRIVKGKKEKKTQKGVDVLLSWFIPLFYIGSDELTVYRYDNKIEGNTYPSMSHIDSSILGGVFSTGYEVFGKTSVIRNGTLYVLASRVKVNDGVYSMTPNYVLYSFKTNKQYPVANPTEMEKVIQDEFSH